MYKKLEELKRILNEYGKVAIAFSGGVDSTFLLTVAVETLGRENVTAVTVDSEFMALDEGMSSRDFCKDRDIKRIVIKKEILKVEGIKNNPEDRCYICKKQLFTDIINMAKDGNYIVCEGSNIDDLSDYRPGLRAIKELNVKSPLREAGLKKEEIRALSKEMNIPTFDKPSRACLASRFVYGEEITEEKLRMVDKAENFIRSRGFSDVRVRIHGDKPNIIARIEVPKDHMNSLMIMNDLTEYLTGIGFTYVSLDLDGFRSGSMNRTIGL